MAHQGNELAFTGLTDTIKSLVRECGFLPVEDEKTGRSFPLFTGQVLHSGLVETVQSEQIPACPAGICFSGG